MKVKMIFELSVLMLLFVFLGYCIITTCSCSAGAFVREVDPSKRHAQEFWVY